MTLPVARDPVVAAVVYPVGIENQNISETHQRDLPEFGGLELRLPKVQGVVLPAIRVICGDLQTKRKKLHQSAFIDVHELAILRREPQRWRMSEICEAEMTTRADLAIDHGCNFARVPC